MNKQSINEATNKAINSDPELPANVAVNREDLLALRVHARGLQLKPCQSGRSLLFGQHQSKFRGRGMDYMESRHYQPGDDVRHFDWRVTARTNHPHIKLYAEEREQPVIILTDLSASMSMASQGAFKSVIAARLASIFGWIAVAQGDRVGGLVFRDAQNHQELKPVGGRRGILHLVDVLVRLGQPHKTFETDSQAHLLDDMLERIHHTIRPGTQLILISDFFSTGEKTKELLQQIRQHSNVLAVQVSDLLELSAPPQGEYGVSDGEHVWLMNLNSQYQRQQLISSLDQRQQDLHQLFSESAIPLLRLLTHDDIPTVLHQVLARQASSCTGNLLMPKEMVA